MGANIDEGIAVGRTANEAFRSIVESRQWEYGHGGYSGTFAEKGDMVFAGTLPARVTFRDLIVAIGREMDLKDRGVWVERFYETVEIPYTNYLGEERTRTETREAKVVKHRKTPLPKALQTPAGRKIVRAFIEADRDKWGPAAGVELNTQESRKNRRPHSRDRAYGFYGLCSS